MKILVVGGGGREHAIIKCIKQNENVTEIFAAPGNGGISKDATCVNIAACDIPKMTEFCVNNKIDFAIVAPDDPLVAGMVDALTKAGVKAFGPSKLAAALEGSKVFSKNLMKKYGIPTATYEVFADKDEAINFIKTNDTYPIVIKADGLALGKGVIIATDFEMAKDAVSSIMEDKVFGESGNNIVVEEFLTGPEVSVLSFCDSKTIVPMISAMDHKRALDNDEGLNTGGMGTIAPNPVYTKEVAEICMKEIFLPTMEAMNKEGRPFKGIIFFGLMITPTGPKVIEYNCRFGDPETQVVLPLLKSDLLDILIAVSEEKLSEATVEFYSNKASACVVLASGGYPQKYDTGLEIEGLNANGAHDEAIIYHAGTKCEGDKFYTAGGRVIGITTVENTLDNALKSAYNVVDKVHFDKKHFRTDIGKKAK